MRRVAFDVNDSLYKHILACCRLATITEGRRVTVAELMRRTVINCLEYDKSRATFEDIPVWNRNILETQTTLEK
jgi:hypothetical protein